MKKILIAIALTGVLAACAGAPGDSPGISSPEQVVYKLHGDYAAALRVAVAYKNLPPCVTATTPICSEPAIVMQVQRADDLAFEALSTAQRMVRAPPSGGVQRAVNLAIDAIGAFVAITSKLKR